MTKFCPQCDTRYDDEDLDHCPEDGKRLRILVDETDIDGDLIGRVLEGRWQIKERLGQGGMGTVFLATQKTVDRQVAIKMLKPALSSTQDYAERFMREANVATSLNNPHCVTVFDFGQTHDGLLYLAMELLEGRALSDVLRDQNLSLRDIITAGTQICSALAAAHDGNIVHRDLKPDNVFLVDVPGGGIFCKVLDFGIAKVIDNDQTPVTQTGQIFGTPAYMSPEQCHSSDVDQRSDLYSLGVILYELVSGRPPFHHSTPIKTLMAHINSELQPPSEIGVPVPERLETVIIRLLEKEADDRFASALDVRDEFEAMMRELDDDTLDSIPAQAAAAGDGETLEFVSGSGDAVATDGEKGVDSDEDDELTDAETEIYEDDAVDATETADRHAPTGQSAAGADGGWSTGLVVMVAISAAVASAALILWLSGKDSTASSATRTALNPNAVSTNDDEIQPEQAEVREPAVALDSRSSESIDREMQPSIEAPADEPEPAQEDETEPAEKPEKAQAEDSEEEPSDVEKDERPAPAEDNAPNDDAPEEPAAESDAPEADREEETSPAVFDNILTSESANRVIKSEFPDVKKCFQKGLASDPSLGGSVQIKMVVSDTGSVTSTELVSSDLDHKEIESCILAEAKTWTFPKPGDGFYRTLSHTFSFNADQ